MVLGVKFKHMLLAITLSPRIFLEGRSTNTTGNIQECLRIIQKQGWRKVAVVSSSYHIPRVAALVELLMPRDEFWSGVCVTYLSAEDVVMHEQPGVHDAEIAAAYGSPLGKQRLENEAQGLRKL